MELKELISKAEEKKALAYEKYQKAESLTTGAMAYYMDMSNAFLELIEALKKMDLPVENKKNSEVVVCPKCKGENQYFDRDKSYACAYTDCGHEWVK